MDGSRPDDWPGVVTDIPGGVRIAVRVKPGVSRARPPRLVDVRGGKRALEIAVRAAAQDGKANAALVREMAAALGCRAADVTIRSGVSSRLKIIEMTGDPRRLRARLAAWLAAEEKPSGQ